MRTRILIAILLVVVFQLLTSTTVLVVGGEFRYIREYAYSTLVEKTENRSLYIKNELQDKPGIVQEYAEQINNAVAKLLRQRNASISELQTNKDLSRGIIESSVTMVANMLRRALANDAYLILDTGELFADEGGATAKAALYLRDMDPKVNAGFEDLLMEIGSTSVSQNFGITRHSGWSMYFEPDPWDAKNFDFYYTTLRSAEENSGLEQDYLGYWSGFSNPSSTISATMKYSLPLIAQDGTVYGVLGIGLLESTVLATIPSRDFMSETACYVLGRSVSEGKYDVLTYSGSDYAGLMGNSRTLQIQNVQEEGIYDFVSITDVELSGSVQPIQLYGQLSPYVQEKWALISVADKTSVLRPEIFLRQMLEISAILSLVVAAIAALLGCNGLVKPISNASKQMKAKRQYNEVIRFQPSNIYEIDEMTDAITQLQINAQGFSSQVSKMISIADVGVGTFMYERGDDSVFVGQSLIKILHLDLPQDEDAVMDREEFLSRIHIPEARSAIDWGLRVTKGKTIPEDHSEVYQLTMENGSTRWMRLGYIYSSGTAIGVVQDVTESVLEKQRIEYERDHDSLTGLLNRHAYYRRIESLFSNKSTLGIAAFVMIDLDNLKFVNDTYGHDFGDDYIKTAALTIRKFQDYGGIVSRISGDEFNICLFGFSSKEEIMGIIESVHSDLGRDSSLMSDGTHFKIRASAGVSWYPDDADNYEALLKYADFAMYTIKHTTKGEIAEFDENAYAQDAVLLTGIKEMNRIIDENSCHYAFQSIVDARTGEVYGYEALMRVKSEIFRSPLELIRTAKSASRLYDIERMTWHNALAEFQQQVDEGRIPEDCHLFINTIANSCIRIVDVEPIEAKHSKLLSRIVIELLEGEDVNQEYLELKQEYMEKWHGQIALDDFGTGYNSEYALLTMRPNIIKIDRSIISNCDKDASRRMMINNLVKLAQERQIRVLAEGVETKEEVQTVISCGVDLLQGYYLARPVFEPQPLAPELAQQIRDFASAAGNSRGIADA